MIEQGFIKKHYVGRDGFIWWIGQIVDSKVWSANLSGYRTETTNEHRGFDYRYKVRIMGYHTSSFELDDEELPWASCMLPVTSGGGTGGSGQTPNLRQGNFVYGFFIDGEDAQQPIIMGVLGYNQYTAISNDTLKGEFPFKPFEGYTNKETVAKYTLKTTKEEPKATQDSTPSTNLNDSKVQDITGLTNGTSEGASLQQKEEGQKEREVPKTSVCEKQPLGEIQLQMKNMIKDLEKAKRSLYDWKTSVSTSIDNAQKWIDKKVQYYSEKIAQGIQWLITEIEKNTIKKVENGLKDLYYTLFPNDRAKFKEKVDKIGDLIACLFRKIIKNLFSMVSKLIVGVVDKIINVPICFAEQFLSTILGGIVGEIVSGIKGILSTISGAVDLATGIADDIIGFLADVFSFLSCDDKPSCPEIDSWSPWDGPSKTDSIDLNSLINGIKNKVTTAVDSATNVANSVAAIPGNLANSINGFAQNPLGGNCDVGPVLCGPPLVEFFGGGGTGARANAIISFAGDILGVDVVSSGSGYSDSPYIKFKDSCGKGSGAVGRAVVQYNPDVSSTSDDSNNVGGTNGKSGSLDISGFNNGIISAVVIEEPGRGYLYVPDGSQGGDGRTFSNYCETIVRRVDGSYDSPYVSGETINLNVGDWIKYPDQAPVKINNTQTATAPTCPEKQSPGISNPVDTNNSYNVDLVIDDFVVIDPGYNYSVGDRVEIVDNPGLDAVVKTVSPTGGIKSISVNKPGSSIINYPEITIDSDSGFNAKLAPKYEIKKLTQEEVEKKLTQGQEVLTVIDCVGKF